MWEVQGRYLLSLYILTTMLMIIEWKIIFFLYFIIRYIFILPSFIKYTGESLKNYMTISLDILYLEPKDIKYAIGVPEPLTQKNSELSEDTCNKIIERAFFFSLSVRFLLPLRLIPDIFFTC